MSSPTQRIKKLINTLPEKDIPFGEKFLNLRDFDSLKELADSALTKIEINLKSGNPKEEYINFDLEGLTTLKSEIDSYLELIGFDDDYEFYNEEY